MKITNNTSIEDLIEVVPESIEFLRIKGIRCIRCGEPIWGSIEEAAMEKGFDKSEILELISELNKMAAIKGN